MHYIQEENRQQGSLLSELLDDYAQANNPVDSLIGLWRRSTQRSLGFSRATLKATGRPPYAPSVLLKLYLYGYVYQHRSTRHRGCWLCAGTTIGWLFRASLTTTAGGYFREPARVAAQLGDDLHIAAEQGQQPFGERRGGCELVVHPGALAARRHQSVMAQIGEVARHRALRQFERIHQIAHAQFAALPEQMHDAQAGRLGECLEEGGVTVHVHGAIVRVLPATANRLTMPAHHGVVALSRGGEMLRTMKGPFPGYDPMRLNAKAREANITAARHPPDSRPAVAAVAPTGVRRVTA